MNSPASVPNGWRPRILILEDDNGVRRSLQLLLQGRGFDVKAYASARALLADPAAVSAACLVTDYRLADSDGTSVLESLRAGGWDQPAILMTAFGSEEIIARAKAAGFDEVFEKPLRDLALVTMLERLTAKPARLSANR